MPSHIFTRLGYWDESIKTNRRSADLEPTPGGKSHPMDYLVYAYLQQGRDDTALAVIKEIGGNTTGEYIAGALGSYNALAMPARLALERDDWKGAAALKVTSAALSAEAAVTHFAKGLGAARTGDVALAKQEVATLEKIVAELTTRKDPYWPIVVDAQRMAVSAWIAHAEAQHAEALRLAREAADKEERVEKHPVTPGPLIPARELLGDILMVHKQPAEALVAYEATLKREPNRTRTIVGAARAASAAGKSEVARTYYRRVIDIMDANATRPELREAKAFVTQK
jgi:tetratricopeptide (TPR) repeat protein